MSEQLWTGAPEGECTDADIGQTSEVQEWMMNQILRWEYREGGQSIDGMLEGPANDYDDIANHAPACACERCEPPVSANDPTPYLPKGFPIDAVVTRSDWQSDQSYYAREAMKDAQDEDDEEGGCDMQTRPTLTMDGTRDDWTCTCGNQSHQDGFYACDPSGHETEPTPEAWDGTLMVCGTCQQIIRMV